VAVKCRYHAISVVQRLPYPLRDGFWHLIEWRTSPVVGSWFGAAVRNSYRDMATAVRFPLDLRVRPSACKVSATCWSNFAAQAICNATGTPTGKTVSVSKGMPRLDIFTLRPRPAVGFSTSPINWYATSAATRYRPPERRSPSGLTRDDTGSDAASGGDTIRIRRW
jgi:hypothetical protein